jgi:uncharacterized coiled-coil DUF342 family protein
MKILQLVSFDAACRRAARLLLALCLLGGSLPASAQGLADTYLELAHGYAALGDEAAASKYRDLYLEAAYDEEVPPDTPAPDLLRQHLGLLRQFLELQPQRSLAKTQGELQQQAERLKSRLRELEDRAQAWAKDAWGFPDNLMQADLIKAQADDLAADAQRLSRQAEALQAEARQSIDDTAQAKGQALIAQAEQLMAQAAQQGDTLKAAAASQLLNAAKRLLERDWAVEAGALAQQAARVAETAARLSAAAEVDAARFIESETKQLGQDAATMRHDADSLSREAALLQARADSLSQAADALSLKNKKSKDQAILLYADAERLRDEASAQSFKADNLKWQADELELQVADIFRDIHSMRKAWKDLQEKSMTTHPGGIDYRKNCPSIFPWPPPRASANHKLPQHLFQAARNLGDIEDQLLRALDQCGYFERSFYCVAPPDEGIGFALAARMEQIDREAYPLPLPDRWSLDIKPLSSFSLREIMQALFFKKPGYFRIVVFIVYDRPFRQSPRPLEQQAALELVAAGSNKLSADIRQVPFSASYSCTALIYEFEAPESGKAPVLVISRHDGKTHLERSRLLEELEKRK